MKRRVVIMFKILRNKFRAFLASMHFWGNPSRGMIVVGVTGTNGKTTTSQLLYQVFMALGYSTGFIGTGGSMLNDKVIESDRKIPTMPDVFGMNFLLRQMAKEKCEYVFMEVTSQGMDQGRASGIKFAGGIFTNLTQDHLDYHRTMERYFQAKKKFFRSLPREAFALANADDPHGAKMLAGIKARKYTYGLKNKADYAEKLETSLIGEFNAYNALAVFAASVLLGADPEKVKEILKHVTPPEGRFNYVRGANGVTGIVDYAHSPDALENVLKTVVKMKNGGKVISVFGCGGDRDPTKRPIMGAIGAEYSDIAIFTADNPRSEDPTKVIEMMQTSLTYELKQKVKIIPERVEAIRQAVALAQSGDFILLAGKGHEPYQEIKGVKYPYSDMAELRKALSV